MTTLKEAAQQALKELEAYESNNVYDMGDSKVIAALRAALSEETMQRLTDVHQQRKSVLHWLTAPTKTEWGKDMVQASVEIDANHTLSLYCERDQIAKVEAMLKPKMKVWFGLTAADLAEIPPTCYEGAIWADGKLMERNR